MRIEDLISYWRKNPVDAAYDIFRVDLAPFQRISINSIWEAPFNINIFTRGGGKTFINALVSALRGCLFPKEQIGLTAPSFRQSSLVFTEVERLYFGSPFFRNCTIKPPTRTPSEYYVAFKGGGKISALPTGDGVKIRGSRFHTLVTDEGAQMPSDIIDQVLIPMAATSKDPMSKVRAMEQMKKLGKKNIFDQSETNRFILSSTAYYTFNHLFARVVFYKTAYGYYLSHKANLQLPIYSDVLIWNAVDKGLITQREAYFLEENQDLLSPESIKALSTEDVPFSPEDGRLYRVTMFDYTDTPEGFMDKNVIKMAHKTLSEDQIDMEYLCKFPSDSSGFFKRSLLDSADSPDVHVELEGVIGRRYIVGVDPARSGDDFGVIILGVNEDDTCYVANVLKLNRKKYEEMHSIIRGIISKYKTVVNVRLDLDGGGLAIRDFLAHPYNGQPAIIDENDKEFQFTPGVRILSLQKFSPEFLKDANFGLKAALEHGTIKFPHATGANYTDDEDKNKEIDKIHNEINELKKQVQNIQLSATESGTLHFSPETRRAKKDLWAALILAHYGYVETIIRKKLKGVEPTEPIQTNPDLPVGGWSDDFGGGAAEESDMALVTEDHISIKGEY